MTARRTAVIAFSAAALIFFGLARSSAQTGLVSFFGPLARVITPNGDGINDKAFFCFENPADSEISGKIYTFLGTQIATMSAKTRKTALLATACPGTIGFAQFTTWDATADNVRVRNGLYVYRITVEDQVFAGTLLVVR